MWYNRDISRHDESMGYPIMIDTIEQTTCKTCGKPLEQVERRGPRLREYCDATCRQRGHRAKSQQQAPYNVTIVTIDEKQALEQRIAQLEREIETLKALRGRRSSLDVTTRHTWQDRAMTWGETPFKGRYFVKRAGKRVRLVVS